MTKQTFDDIYTDELAKDAIINNEFPGFREDYLVLHCLIKKYKPKTFFEIGTNFGSGTRIIKNAIGEGDVYTLDLPFDRLHHTMIQDGRDVVGMNCNLPFTQLRGDSLTFDYSQYPCEGYFIDGEHDMEHVFIETKNITALKPEIIIWHDLHVLDVERAINSAMLNEDAYNVYRVEGTRIAYALRDAL